MATTLEPGRIHFGVTDADYRKIPAVSSTAIKAGRRSLRHMRHAMLHPSESSEAMDFGSLADTIILEPDELPSRFHVVAEIPPRNSKAGKAAHVAMTEAAAGRIVVTKADVEATRAMFARLLEHPAASRQLATKGHTKPVALWWDEETGLLCKAQIDRYHPGVIALDLKTARDASPFGFARQAANLGYHIQVGWYRHGFRVCSGVETPFTLIAIEKDGEYEPGVYTIPDQALAAGYETCRRVIKAFAEAQKTGDWPGYSQKVEELDWPKWGYRVDGPDTTTNDDDHAF